MLTNDDVIDHPFWPDSIPTGYRSLANEVLWDLRLSGPIVDARNGTQDLRLRLEARGVHVPKSPPFGQLLKVLGDAGIIMRHSSGTRLREIRLGTRKALPPNPFELDDAEEMEAFEADIAQTPVEPTSAVSVPEALAKIARLAGDALVDWATQEAAVAVPTIDHGAGEELSALRQRVTHLTAELAQFKALATAEAKGRHEAELTIAGLLNGGRVQEAQR